MLPQPPTPTIEDEFLPKAGHWNRCYCCVCNFFLNNPEWHKYRQRYSLPLMQDQQGLPVKTKPTKICRTLWLDWHRDIHDGGLHPFSWEDETSEYNPDRFKEPPFKKKKG